MPNTYIIDGVRTPIGRLGGALAHLRADDLAAVVLRSLVSRQTTIPAGAYDDVIMGCANQAGEDNRNVSRMALLLAGLPHTVPGETVNRLCASGLSAVIGAHRTIQCGDGHLVIAGGIEHMTRGPWVISKTSTPFGRDAEMFDSSFGWRFVNPKMKAQYGVESMGQTAENLVDLHHISREDQDRFALWSQQKAAAAQQSGRLAQEIVAVEIPQGKKAPIIVEHDEFLRPDTTLESLAALRPAFRETGTVTAGNASGLNDGAVALLLASEQAVEQYQLRPLAKVVASAVVGVEPRIMGIGPVEATRRALAKAGIGLGQIDHIELNEAFAAQALACTRSLGLTDNDSRINPNGGAIALGHPLGMSGARICLSAALELQNKGLRYALVTMCIGVGQGYAAVLERV